ncbi:MAG: GtrA family protein [Propionibacteriaceae bacterium]|nr:GtrA family protein [Propionibacteriaceae bacterium]
MEAEAHPARGPVGRTAFGATLLGQFTRFGLVGGSGVLVNFSVYYLCCKLAPLVWPSAASPKTGVFWDLPWTDFNIRWYHTVSMVAFVCANLWNYELNRRWTFKAVTRSASRPGWWRSFWRFFVVGLLAQLIGLLVETALLHAHSPLQLPSSLFDESSGLRNPAYWAHGIMILVTIPVSFLLNKFWSFRGRATAPQGCPSPPPDREAV